MYSYYMTQRPPCPGAQPRNGLVNVHELDPDSDTPGIGRAYAMLEYDRELTEDEVRNYELTPADRPKPVIYKGYQIVWNDWSHDFEVINRRGFTIAHTDTVLEAQDGIDTL